MDVAFNLFINIFVLFGVLLPINIYWSYTEEKR